MSRVTQGSPFESAGTTAAAAAAVIRTSRFAGVSSAAVSARPSDLTAVFVFIVKSLSFEARYLEGLLYTLGHVQVGVNNDKWSVCAN